MIFGVDVSASQGVIDPKALAGAGCSFVYAKATDGINSTDKCWHDNAVVLTGFEDMPWGAYGVLEPYGIDKAEEQAQHFLTETLKFKQTLPPWLDLELAQGLKASDVVSSAIKWRDCVQQAIGRSVMVYASPAFVEQLSLLGGAPTHALLAQLAAGSPLAVAHYTGDFKWLPKVPDFWDDYVIWQTSGGRKQSPNYATLPGTDIDVDVDLFRGTPSDLLAL
jgi:GH25 family lysozyme M1 (1,4-beta-N-acetylmuramidase)